MHKRVSRVANRSGVATAVSLMNTQNLRGIRGDSLGGFVSGAVVDHDDFEVRIVLREHAAQRFIDECCRIVGR